MAEHNAPGESTADRLLARAARGLQRKDVGGGQGGEVFSGDLASRALKSMGARAMTLDEHVIVDETFDPDAKAEDAALYAHERVHVEGSGGHDANGSRDSEEIAARAVEGMVFHRRAAGESFGSIMRDMKESGAASIHRSAKAPVSRTAADSRSNRGTGGGTQGAASAQATPASEDEAKAAYAAMIAAGKTHAQIVRDLARYVVNAMQNAEERNTFRQSPAKSV